jgi:hypothetical protein
MDTLLADLNQKLGQAGPQTSVAAKKQVDVFQDLRDKGTHFTLPPPPALSATGNGADGSRAGDLFRLFVDDPAACRLEILGEVFGGGGSRFLLTDTGASDERVWNLQHVVFAEEEVGKFVLKDQQFSFQWSPNRGKEKNDRQLANCVLLVSVGDRQERVWLRQPAEGRPPLDLEGDYAVNCDFVADSYPETCDIVLEISPQGLPQNLLADAAPLALTKDTPTKTWESATNRFGGSQLPRGSKVRAVAGAYRGPFLKLLVWLEEAESHKPEARSRQERHLWLRARFVACDALRDWLQKPERSFLVKDQFGFVAATESKTERSSKVDSAAEVELKPSSLRGLYNSLVSEERSKTLQREQYKTLIENAKKEIEAREGQNKPEEVRKWRENLEKNQSFYERADDSVQRVGPDKEKIRAILERLNAVEAIQGRVYAKFPTHEVDLARFVAGKNQ